MRPKKFFLNIVYEDELIIVVNKPAGFLTIADAKTPRDHCLYHQVYEHVNRQSGGRIFIVHRLDKDTSGLIIFAKNAELKERLQSLFEAQLVTRRYEAVVEGVLKKKDRIKVHLFTDRFNNIFVGSKGDIAITNYRVVATDGSNSYLDIDLITGRRNQIRASLESIGHPIIGDKKYHGQKNDRLLLNAYRLAFPAEEKLLRQHEFETKKIFSSRFFDQIKR